MKFFLLLIPLFIHSLEIKVIDENIKKNFININNVNYYIQEKTEILCIPIHQKNYMFLKSSNIDTKTQGLNMIQLKDTNNVPILCDDNVQDIHQIKNKKFNKFNLSKEIYKK